uniref:Uncharacterized protein n=1 Tax=Dicentrarchus labrax TaxID=13489 RepID=A0A8P4KAU6_DICLA
MSPVVDETAGDLPVRDVGMRGGLMPTVPDPQRLFRFSREHLEDLCLRLQEENSVLRQHTRTQEQSVPCNTEENRTELKNIWKVFVNMIRSFFLNRHCLLRYVSKYLPTGR